MRCISMKKILTLTLIMCAILCGCADSESNVQDTTVPIETTTAQTTTTAETTVEPTTIEETTVISTQAPVSNNGLKSNLIDNNKFADINGLKSYSDGSIAGIDVSSYNGDIDWASVKNSGIDFAMIRIGGRGYGESGVLYSDDNAIQNINNAKANGIKVGVYFFSQAINETEAIEEADYIYSLLNGTKLDFPIGFDWETIENDTARTDNVTPQELTACARAFCDRVRELGDTPVIYSESYELYNRYNLQSLSDIDIWYCEYAETPNFNYEFSMWQYSKTGTINGIDGPVDLNICFTDIADYD